jgi:hypothetical protein
VIAWANAGSTDMVACRSKLIHSNPWHGCRMTIVGHEARRRWTLVLAVVAVLTSLPAVVAAWPTTAPEIGVDALREKIRASVGQPYQGYAQSTGALGLPAFPRLGQVTALLSSTTELRTWYAARNRWRVDVVDLASERGLYQTPEGQYTWDYGAQLLTFLPAADAEFKLVTPNSDTVVYVFGGSPIRLPRAADLVPPDLARRLLSAAAADRAESLPARRVAGIAAAGLRIVPTDPHSTVGHVDVWADPATGLPLQVELTAKGAERPILVTRFLEVDQRAPDAGALVPPQEREGMSMTTPLAGGDPVDALVDQTGFFALPDRLAGQQRRHVTDGGVRAVLEANSFALYGTGLAQVAVVPLSRQIGGDAYRTAAAWGQQIAFPAGSGALIATSLLSVMVVESGVNRRRFRYLVAGMVDNELLRQIGAELASVRR